MNNPRIIIQSDTQGESSFEITGETIQDWIDVFRTVLFRETFSMDLINEYIRDPWEDDELHVEENYNSNGELEFIDFYFHN